MTTQAPPPRYEFRLFAQCFEREELRLRAMAECESITESQEVYFLGRTGSYDRNVKIRGDKLELKCLLERRHGLELWNPAGMWTFPAPASVILDLLGQAPADVDIPGLPASLSREALQQLAERPDVPLHRATVFKRRFLFVLPPCRTEVDQLLVNGAAIGSLAMESEDPQAVLELRADLQLGDRANVSYPLALARILGIASWPDEARHE